MNSQTDEGISQRLADIDQAIERSENRIASSTAKAADRTLIACRMMKHIDVEIVGEWLRNSATAPALTKALQSNSVFIGNHLVFWTKEL